MLPPIRILITGASGFIGKHLVDKLLEMPCKIACIDLAYNDHFLENYGKKVHLFKGNLLDKNFIGSCVQQFKPEYVFHLAGSKNRINSLEEFESSNEVNYKGTLYLFQELSLCKSLKLVTSMGTIEEYGSTTSPFKEDSQESPNSAYGLSKLSVTKLASIFHQQFNLPTLVLRPSIAYGPGQGEEMFIPALINTLLKQQPFKMTEGNQLRDFIFIDDLIAALVKTLSCKGIEGKVINIASGASVKLKDIALQVAELINSKQNLKIGEIPYRGSEIMEYTVDISRASAFLQWYPTTKLLDGLKKTIAFYQRNLPDKIAMY